MLALPRLAGLIGSVDSYAPETEGAEMKTQANHLRQAIAAIQQHEPFQARRYPAELQRAVVAYTHEQRGLGRRPRRIAHELGLTEQTLASWMRAGAAPLRRVVVKPVVRQHDHGAPVAATSVVVTLPGGQRIEGLAFEQLVMLARALS